ncbi:hypothetical protein, partial [Erythrobacter sp. YJ-T3-07]|uniref:hypothetical protein n=1 Tax=Erythrobacter sp. YJ-T3-07 TaxID=2793063 RepID=UPI001F48E3F7
MISICDRTRIVATANDEVQTVVTLCSWLTDPTVAPSNPHEPGKFYGDFGKKRRETMPLSNACL